MAELNNSLNPTGTILKGPVNQTVRVNQKARFQCRTHDRHTHGITGEQQTYRYSKHLSVQWIINGFGVTNETLTAVHGTRYRMPGPPEYGIYDLIISDVRLEDEANLICQATVKLYKASGETVIDMLTSAVTHLNILVPPTGISMKKAESFDKNLHDSEWLSPKFKVVNQQYVKLSTTPQSPTHTLLSGTGHVVADDPTIELTRKGTNSLISTYTPKPDQFLNPKELINNGQNADVKGDAQTLPTIWIKEHDTLVMACYTTPSKPASKITWTLAGRSLEVARYNSQTGSGTYFGLENQPDALASQLEGDQEVRISETYIFAPMKNTEQSSTVQRDNSKDEWGDVGNNTDVHTDTQVTISTLRLIVGRHHRGKPLECSIENVAEYGIPNLPTVGVILEAIYIEKVSILRLQPKDQTEWIEGTTVEFQCQAKSNPPNPSFRWAFVDFESMPNSIATNGTHEIYHHPIYFGKRDKPIQSSSIDPSILNLRLHRGMHRGRVRCWAGVGDAAGLPWSGFHASEKQWVWQRADEEIKVLYSPVFLDQAVDLLAAKVGQTLHIDCAVDANPLAKVSLYRIGPNGQRILSTLGEMEMLASVNQSDIEINFRKDSKIVYGSRYSTSRPFTQTTLAEAIESTGSQVLFTAISRLRYALRVIRSMDFGYYACVARNNGFPPVLKHLLVGQSGPPRIVQLLQVADLSEDMAHLSCYIYGIPRPNANEVTWLRDGNPVKPSKGLTLHYEPMTLGVLAKLIFHHIEQEDFANYNCTASNEYGSVWRTIKLNGSYNVPLTFLIGSGAAALLAVLLVIMLCCFVRYARDRSFKNSAMTNGNVVMGNSKSDVVQVNHVPEKEALTFDLELQPIFSLPVDPVGTIRYDPLEGVHFDQDTTTTSSSTARMSNSLISQYPREEQMNAEQSSDTKLSQADFWKENSDGATFINTTCSSKINCLPKDNAPQWSTVFVGHTSPVRQNAYYSLVSPRQLHPYQHGETFANAHVEACFVSSSSQSMSELPLNSMYDSIHNPSVTTVLVVSTPYSVDTTAGNTGVYGNTHTATGLLFPSVMFHPQPPTFLPQKYPCINPVPDFSSITTNVNRLSLDISPDITVLPLNFCEALPVYDPPRAEIREFSKTPKMNTTQGKRNTDDDCGTYL